MLQNKFHLKSLIDFLKYPSLSTDPNYKPHIESCANWLQTHLQEIGLNTEKHVTPGHPIITAECLSNPNAPTVLIYGHYDVQPEDPLDLWDTPPFEPTIRNGNIYARGASDNKGQIYAHIAAVATLLKETGTLPVNVKFLIEGEEEIGSPNLTPFIEANKEKLKANIALVSDTPMFAKDQPSLCISLRGLAYTEVTLNCLKGDLHSGQHGGPAPNAINELIKLLSQLKDPKTDRVLIPGFYDEVKEIPSEIRKMTKSLKFDETSYKKTIGTSALQGEEEFHPLERIWFRPTCEINGIIGGYTKEGAKTVLPATATAKISCRLVANQSAKKTRAQLKDYLNKIAPSHVQLNFKTYNDGEPVQVSTDSHYVTTALNALETAFKTKPILQGEGGTIPVIADFQKHLGIDTILMGLNLPDDNIHAPNERFSLTNFERGIQASMGFLKNCNAQ